MNCYYHPETPSTAFCRSCGRPLCAACQRPAEGTVYCQDHVPATAYAAYTAPEPPNPGAPNPYFQPAAAPPTIVRTSPALAFILGLVPGVGAIYNGQYLKGLIHALVFGLLVTAESNAGGSGAEALLGILIAAFVLYMPFEAYHTAKRREAGLPVDEWSTILPQKRGTGRVPVGPILLIAIGVLYLLNSLNLVDFREISRFWPVILIVVGAYMLYNRVTSVHAPPAAEPPTGSPRYSKPNSGPGPNDFAESRREQ
jgi:hypothetical protein